MPDTSRLQAAVQAHRKAADDLISLASHLSYENAELRERLEAAYAANPTAEATVEQSRSEKQAQANVDDAAASLEAETKRITDTVGARTPQGTIPEPPPRPETKTEAAADAATTKAA